MGDEVMSARSEEMIYSRRKVRYRNFPSTASPIRVASSQSYGSKSASLLLHTTPSRLLSKPPSRSHLTPREDMRAIKRKYRLHGPLRLCHALSLLSETKRRNYGRILLADKRPQ